jgi:hypothetical protein
LLQICATLHRLYADRLHLELAFETADRCLQHQDPISGAFESPGEADGLCSYTALMAIGLADAWLVARLAEDRRRTRRYAQAWSAAIEFSRALIVRAIDAPMLKEPSRSIGGVRAAQASAMMTTDAASHLIFALTKGLYAMRARA